jgi:PAS domain S-box-containing protein
MVPPEMRVVDVLRLLRGAAAGAALVVKGGRLFGLITPRECVFAALRYRNVAEVSAADLMYAPVPTAPPGTGLAAAYAAMAEHGLCHLAVMDPQGGISGLISADDCWTGLAGELAARAPDPFQAMVREVVTVKETDSVALAIRNMARHSVGCVVAERGGFPVGLLTVGDIAPLVQRGADLAAVPVGLRMGRRLATLLTSAKAEEALSLLAERGVWRLIVTNQAGRLVGLVSRHDLMRSFLDSRRTGREPARAQALEVGELARTGEEWKAVADAAAEALALLGPDGRVVRANRAFAQRVGREAEDLAGYPAEELIHAPGHPPLPLLGPRRRATDLILNGGDPRNPFGVPVAIDCHPWPADGRSPTGSLLAIRDLSLAFQAEAQQRLWCAALECLREGVVVATPEGNIELVNHAFCEIVGHGEQDLLGLDLRLLETVGPAATLFRALSYAVRETGRWEGEVAVRGRDGQIRPRWLTVVAVEDDRNRTTRFLGVVSEAPTTGAVRRGADPLAGLGGLDLRLRRAIERDELSLRYQPLMEIPSGRVIGVEALVRWDSGDAGMTAPADFIPLAEQSGLLMRQVDQWALRRACEQGRAWLEAGVRFGRIAANVAESHVRRQGFAEGVRRILEETGLPGSHLELDIAEAVLVAHGESLAGELGALRDLGVGIAIDNFGAGPTSLALLASLPVQRLKLDRSLLRPWAGGSNLACAAIALGHRLGLAVVAKGVEAEWQRDELLEGGCGEAQGFLYSQPVGAEEATRMLGA